MLGGYLCLLSRISLFLPKAFSDAAHHPPHAHADSDVVAGCCLLAAKQQDVETQLQPILEFLTSLGLDAQHAARMSCVYPELLLSSVKEQLQPLVDYLQGLGCSAAQAARLLQVGTSNTP